MIETLGLEKKFKDVAAVNGINLTVQTGEIFGLLGENGAGKTTTLRMLATMLMPTSGTARVGGFDIIKDSEKVRANIGVLFGSDVGLYDRLTTKENIAYFGQLNGMDAKDIDKNVMRLADAFGLSEYIDKKAGKLSKGNRQKTAFARTVIHDPDYMFFDEPTSGLDIRAASDVHAFIKQCKAQGKTIVLSSHHMDEVEKLCDRIAILHKGEIMDIGTIKELVEKYNCEDLEQVFFKLTEGA